MGNTTIKGATVLQLIV